MDGLSTTAAGIASPALSLSPTVPNNPDYITTNNQYGDTNDNQPPVVDASGDEKSANSDHHVPVEECNNSTANTSGDCDSSVLPKKESATESIAQTNTSKTTQNIGSKNLHSTAVDSSSAKTIASPSASELKNSNQNCDSNSKNCKLIFNCAKVT